MSQYDGDDTMIEATPGSAFFLSLPQCSNLQPGQTCEGTAAQWVNANFTDWSADQIPWNALYLIGLIVLTRGITFYALTNWNYRST